jgi:hypothetical protein
MDYLAIQEDALIDISRMQREVWTKEPAVAQERAPKISTEDGEYLMNPKDVITLIKRLRAVGPCNIHTYVNTDMPVSATHVFPALGSVELTLKTATHLLESFQRTQDTRVEAGKEKPMLRVKLDTWDKRFDIGSKNPTRSIWF